MKFAIHFFHFILPWTLTCTVASYSVKFGIHKWFKSEKHGVKTVTLVYNCKMQLKIFKSLNLRARLHLRFQMI
jgi:hypothetical protein